MAGNTTKWTAHMRNVHKAVNLELKKLTMCKPTSR